jgi:hypothetical protein
MHALRSAYFGLAALTLALVVLQFFLAGLGIFGATDNFDAHEFVGFALLHLTTILMLIVALVGRLGRSAILFGGGLLVLVVIQSFLPSARDDAPVIAALHPLVALVILGGAAQATQYARAWRTGGSEGATA